MISFDICSYYDLFFFSQVYRDEHVILRKKDRPSNQCKIFFFNYKVCIRLQLKNGAFLLILVVLIHIIIMEVFMPIFNKTKKIQIGPTKTRNVKASVFVGSKMFFNTVFLVHDKKLVQWDQGTRHRSHRVEHHNGAKSPWRKKR